MVDRSLERRPSPKKAAPLVLQALGEHRRDAFAQRDAIECARDLHDAILVRNRDQLQGLLKFLEDRQQAPQTSREQT